ncbi:MAG TPA: methyltransferase domain-containing protein [Acidimicrobiales bacterium]|nr:methyltransferase domain-containing protein [Acidimicrobiales bacterium]
MAYTHGHHPSVLRSHTWRTATNSAAYLLGSLQAGQDLLDVGCGPGTITLDLAELVAPGRVVGVDAAAEVVAQADELRRSRGVPNAEFRAGDVYGLDLPDASFDVVHAHQVLQHLTDPVTALVEMRRVLRPGGILGVRDSDYGAFVWWPDVPELTRWTELYHQVTARNGADADAGRRLFGWVQRAGFVDVVAGSSTWTFSDPESRAWWAGSWAERVERSALADQAVAYGLADAAELSAIAAGWRRWAEAADGFFAVLHAEVLARCPVAL